MTNILSRLFKTKMYPVSLGCDLGILFRFCIQVVKTEIATFVASLGILGTDRFNIMSISSFVLKWNLKGWSLSMEVCSVKSAKFPHSPNIKTHQRGGASPKIQWPCYCEWLVSGGSMRGHGRAWLDCWTVCTEFQKGRLGHIVFLKVFCRFGEMTGPAGILTNFLFSIIARV